MTKKTLSSQAPVIWFTGLPCSGKTTLSLLLEKELVFRGHRVVILDGDTLRKTICRDLGFSRADRVENIRRVAYLAKLLCEQGFIVIVALVSPYRKAREEAKSIIGHFYEVFVDCSLSECQSRDVKGYYRQARAGKLRLMTGVDSAYEIPLKPDIRLDTQSQSSDQCLNAVLIFLEGRGLVFPARPIFKSNFLKKVDCFAERYHRGQCRRGGNLPYITHPRAVASLLESYGYDESVIAAGLLHDVLEDTGCEVENLVRCAGARVATLVCCVTDRDITLPKHKRKKLYLKNLSKASKKALAVACADKIHNIQSLIELYQKDQSLPSKIFQSKLSDKIRNYQKIYRLILQRYPSCPLLPVYAYFLKQLVLCADLAVFTKREKESTISCEAILKKLKVDGKI